MDRSTADLFPDKECRLILIGKTGAGKSSTGNTILGHTAFVAQTGINSETKLCGRKSAKRNGLQITVMDTPGLSDTDGDDSVIAKRIAQSLLAVHKGLHAVVLVLRCDNRFTDEEVQVYKTLKDIFGEDLVHYLIIIFVGVDRLPSIPVFEQQLARATKLQTIMKEANNRYVLFNNEATGDAKIQQMDIFMANVKDVVRKNNKCFRVPNAEDIDAAVENMIVEEIENIDGKKLSFRQRKPRGTPTATEKEGSESTPVHRREVEELGKLQGVKAARAKFEQRSFKSSLSRTDDDSAVCLQAGKSEEDREKHTTLPTRPQSGDQARHGWQRDGGTELPSPRRKAPPPPGGSPGEPKPEGTQSLAEMLEELALKDKLLDQLRASYDEEYNYPDAEGRTNIQMAEDLVMIKVLNKEEELSPGQKQLLDKTQHMVDLEVRNGMKKNGIKDVRALAKCSLM